jgi:hypothetical protein
MRFIVAYADGSLVSAYEYKTIDGAEKKAVRVYKETGRPTVVVDKRYWHGRKNGKRL